MSNVVLVEGKFSCVVQFCMLHSLPFSLYRKLELFVTCNAASVHLTIPSHTSPPTKGGATLVLDQQHGRCFTEQLTNTLNTLTQQYQ